MKKDSVGIVVGRFQVPELTLAHKDLLSFLANKNHTETAIFLGSSIYPNRNNPLSYTYRRAKINEYLELKNLTIFNIVDEKDNNIWSSKLDLMIQEQYKNFEVTLYGGRDSFINRYSGKFKNSFCDVTQYGINYLDSGTISRNSITSSNSTSFGKGIIFAFNNQYPSIKSTVDIAVIDKDTGALLVIEKKSDNGFHRFPGGHIDLNDTNLRISACRELREEVGISQIFNNMIYIGSSKINDWRFTDKNNEGVMTTFFCTFVDRKTIIPIANDDADYCGWMSAKDFDKIIVEEHKILLKMLIESPNYHIYRNLL